MKTLLGFRKDLMDTLDSDSSLSSASQPIPGSSHTNRVMLKSQKSRELLLKYSGYSRDRKCLHNPKSLTPSEIKQLQSLLRKEGAVKLAQVINPPESENNHRQAPKSYREFLYELSLNTPVCGILQIAGNEEAIRVVQLVAMGIDMHSIGVSLGCFKIQLQY